VLESDFFAGAGLSLLWLCSRSQFSCCYFLCVISDTVYRMFFGFAVWPVVDTRHIISNSRMILLSSL